MPPRSTHCRRASISIARAFRRDLELAETRARHETLIDEAHRRGAFGVPTFFLEDRMFWGNDRLQLLEAALRGADLPRWRSI